MMMMKIMMMMIEKRTYVTFVEPLSSGWSQFIVVCTCNNKNYHIILEMSTIAIVPS